MRWWLLLSIPVVLNGFRNDRLDRSIRILGRHRWTRPAAQRLVRLKRLKYRLKRRFKF